MTRVCAGQGMYRRCTEPSSPRLRYSHIARTSAIELVPQKRSFRDKPEACPSRLSESCGLSRKKPILASFLPYEGHRNRSRPRARRSAAATCQLPRVSRRQLPRVSRLPTFTISTLAACPVTHTQTRTHAHTLAACPVQATANARR